MTMWKFTVMFDILNVDKVCTAILSSFLTENASTAYTHIYLQQYAIKF
jgi:hypothetical protein